MRLLFSLLLLASFGLSCTRNNVLFGERPDSDYTQIVFTDTVTVSVSTTITDSFATNAATSLLLGRYYDTYLGVISTRNFFQFNVVESQPELGATDVYDSITLTMRLNGYYYGDTARLQTITVSELSETITYSYSSALYNTSSTAVSDPALGSRQVRIRPHVDDSLVIRLDDSKGADFYNRIRNKSTVTSNQSEFVNYFRGISLTTGVNDTAAVYGLTGLDSSMYITIHYHSNTPFPVKKTMTMKALGNDYTYNQLLANRLNSGVPQAKGDYPASLLGGKAFHQPSTGAYIKLGFPSLRNVVNSGKLVRLVRAELLLSPAATTYDKGGYALPSSLGLTQTDATNLFGSTILDSTGSSALAASPELDELYGRDNYYRFNITSYISTWMNTPGSEKNGFYLASNFSPTAPTVDRLVVNLNTSNQLPRLRLYMIVLNQ